MNQYKYGLAVLFGSIFAIQAVADDEKLDHYLKIHFEQYYEAGTCHKNIRNLLKMLAHYDLADMNKNAYAVIAESNDNSLVVGTEKDRYAYHVFLVIGERVFDPLMLEMFAKYYADRNWYLLNMFPYLRGVRFTSMPAIDYVNLDLRDIAMIFRDYDLREGLFLGQMRIQEIPIQSDTVRQIWRQPLTSFMRSLGWIE